MEVKNIYEGWRNILKEKISQQQLDPIVSKKIKTCSNCSLLTKMLICNPKKTGLVVTDFQYGKNKRTKNSIVNGCGCFIPAKARSQSKCPLGKWENLDI